MLVSVVFAERLVLPLNEGSKCLPDFAKSRLLKNVTLRILQRDAWLNARVADA